MAAQQALDDTVATQEVDEAEAQGAFDGVEEPIESPEVETPAADEISGSGGAPEAGVPPGGDAASAGAVPPEGTEAPPPPSYNFV